MTIKILDEAEKDIVSAIIFYEDQKVGLGDYFLDSIMSDVESLQIYNKVHIKIKGLYRSLSKRFPFAIYYKVENETIYIYAVLDCRKDPTWINNRL